MKAADDPLETDEILLRGLLTVSELSGSHPIDLEAIETTVLQTLTGTLHLRTLLYFRSLRRDGTMQIVRCHGAMDGCEFLYLQHLQPLEGRLLEYAMQAGLPLFLESPGHPHTRPFLPSWLQPLQPGGVFILPLVDEQLTHGLMLGWTAPANTISYTPTTWQRFLAIQQLLILCLRKQLL